VNDEINSEQHKVAWKYQIKGETCLRYIFAKDVDEATDIIVSRFPDKDFTLTKSLN